MLKPVALLVPGTKGAPGDPLTMVASALMRNE